MKILVNFKDYTIQRSKWNKPAMKMKKKKPKKSKSSLNYRYLKTKNDNKNLLLTMTSSILMKVSMNPLYQLNITKDLQFAKNSKTKVHLKDHKDVK